MPTKIKWKLGIPKKDGYYLVHIRSYTLSHPCLVRLVKDQDGKREIIGAGIGIFPVSRLRGTPEVYFSQRLDGVR